MIKYNVDLSEEKKSTLSAYLPYDSAESWSNWAFRKIV